MTCKECVHNRVCYIEHTNKTTACAEFKDGSLWESDDNPARAAIMSRWHSIKGNRVPEWEDFSAFQEYALSNGFTAESNMRRIDAEEPWGPHNCRIYTPVPTQSATPEWVDNWNKNIHGYWRKLNGLSPLKEENNGSCG